MAQSGYTPIQLYYSSTTTNTPSAGNLTAGELAINTADGKLFYKDSGGTVQIIATKDGASGTVSSVALSGGTTGLTVSGSPITTSGTITLAGTLAIANGGSGQTTAQTAMNAFAGAVTSGSYLRGDGTNVVMNTIQAADVPTLNQNTTGSAATLTTARTIQTNLASTSSASFNGSANITPGVTGTLPVANGGTGATTLAGANIAVTNAAQSFTAAQRGAISALTDGATITPDFALGNNYSVTLGGNRTLANPSNLVAGQSGSIFISQDGTGGRTLAWGSYWDFANGTAPTLTTTASAVDRVDYVVRSSTSIQAVWTGNYS